jgi:1,4-alpha-glucan branching enzyme
MKLKHCIAFFLLIGSLHLFAQKEEIKGYRIEGDEVVFTFDKRDYEIITDEKKQLRMDFDDFDIKNVVVSGQFNLWSRDAWKMKKVNENIYELRKKIADFDDEFNWEFKFVINNNFWAEPTADMLNITPAVNTSGKYVNTFNLKFFHAYVTEKGNTRFTLDGFEDAKKVVLAGSFNKWDEGAFRMKKEKNGWKITLQLRPDVHEYKFIVDGEWMEDPANPHVKPNEFGGYNSLIEVQTDVQFKLFGFPNAKQVILAGDFNDWSETDCRMTKTEKGWTHSVRLTGGKYHYKFIVDGVWMIDPNNKVREYDGKGNINSVRMVR